MSKTKVDENYTAEATAELVEAYTAADSAEARDAVIATFSEKLAKSIPSIRQKLVREQVYVAKPKVGKKGGVKKADVVNAITAIVPMPANDADSLTKATMGALRAVSDALASFKAEAEAVDAEVTLD